MIKKKKEVSTRPCIIGCRTGKTTMQINNLNLRLCGAAMEKMTSGSEKYRRNRMDAFTEMADAFRSQTPKMVYVCSPYHGATEEETAENVAFARKSCEYLAKDEGLMPFAPHLFFTQFLDDDEDADRKMGFGYGLAFLSLADEVWVFGERISAGMKGEIARAESLGIPVKYVDLVPEGGEAHA